jgi:hypothetical protein
MGMPRKPSDRPAVSAPKPLSREERDILLSHLVYPTRNPETVDWDGESVPDEAQLHELWEATVQAVEDRLAEVTAERDALLALVEADDPHGGAWFVAVGADGLLDRSWPESAEGGVGRAGLFGREGNRIVKVVPSAVLTETRAQRDALRAALIRYGNHDDYCRGRHAGCCSCGYLQAAALGEEPTDA